MARRVSKKDSKIVLTAHGEWMHKGKPVTHKRMSDYFHKQIRKDPLGDFYIYNSMFDPVKKVRLEEHVYFEVEDTAYFVQDILYDSIDQLFSLSLNTGTYGELDLATLVQNDAGALYCTVFQNDRARFSNSALFEISSHIETDAKGLYILQGTNKFYIGHTQ